MKSEDQAVGLAKGCLLLVLGLLLISFGVFGLVLAWAIFFS